MRIERWYVERDGVLSEVALQRKIESLGFMVTARVYPEGRADLPALVHGQVGLSGVVRGLVKMTIDGESTYLAPGDIVFVPPGATRTIEVTGPSAPLCLEALPRPTD